MKYDGNLVKHQERTCVRAYVTLAMEEGVLNDLGPKACPSHVT